MLGSFRAASTLASRAKRPMQSASEAKDCGRILSATVAVKVAVGCPIHFSHAGFAEHGGDAIVHDALVGRVTHFLPSGTRRYSSSKSKKFSKKISGRPSAWFRRAEEWQRCAYRVLDRS